MFGPGQAHRRRRAVEAMVASQRHRGPDSEGIWAEAGEAGLCALGHNRLSILDLSAAGRQPMASADGRWRLAFNGEIYNYVELRGELGGAAAFQTATDTEVILRAWERWGAASLDRLIGMFAFLLYDTRDQVLYAARDRFGVKPLYYGRLEEGALLLASEIKALFAAGHAAEPDETTWAGYLATGAHELDGETFWAGIRAVPAGSLLTMRRGGGGEEPVITRWYDLPERVGPDVDARGEAEVCEEYLALLSESVQLRFRADVPVGINLSGGLDSSILLGIVDGLEGAARNVKAFTFTTGDDRYDELPWVERMLARTHHASVISRLSAEEVPALAAEMQSMQDEPYGGLPTLAYAKLFQRARSEGVIVLLDGQGMDEQWAGYDYYRRAVEAAGNANEPARLVQGSIDSPVRPACLAPEFLRRARPFRPPEPFGADRLRNLQYRDLYHTKIPRALRFNDRASMRSSVELREPFLDHRLVELAFRQPAGRKIRNGEGKFLLRQMTSGLLAEGVQAPKRPVQTPQREWLRGPLADWAGERIEALAGESAWFDQGAMRAAWRGYLEGEGDNSYWVWQWLSAAMMLTATNKNNNKKNNNLVTTTHV